MTGNTRRLFLTGMAAASLAAFSSIGCSPITMAYFLFKGDGKKPATYPLEPVSKDRKDVRIVVMAANGPGMTWEFAGLDRDVASQMAKQLAEGTREEKHPIKVIRPDDVDRYKASHPNWRTMEPDQLAKELGADYLIDVSITGVGLYQQGTGNVVYEGWATADVVVYRAGQKVAVHEYNHKSQLHPAAGDSLPAGQYKSQVIKRFATELASRHMKHTEDSRKVAPLSQ